MVECLMQDSQTVSNDFQVRYHTAKLDKFRKKEWKVLDKFLK